MVGICTVHWTLLIRGIAVIVGFLLLLGVGMGSAVEAPSEILIGATLPLSGRFTPMAGTFDRLCQSWAKLVNSRGGLIVETPSYSSAFCMRASTLFDFTPCSAGGFHRS